MFYILTICILSIFYCLYMFIRVFLFPFRGATAAAAAEAAAPALVGQAAVCADRQLAICP